MEKFNILIFSSEQAHFLANALENSLKDFCETRLWKKEKELSQAFELDLLVDAAKRYDFAVLFLTSADGRSETAGGEHQQEKTRASLLFEYGLLIGALGRGRCFLAADQSVFLALLPQVLSSINLSFKEPSELTENTSEDVVRTIIGNLKDSLQKMGPRKRSKAFELLSFDQLFQREKPKPNGDLTTNSGNVVVASLQPGEMVHDRACRVMDNIKSGIDYVYFFPGDSMFAGKLAQLLQMLLLCKRISPEEAKDKQSRCRAIQNQVKNVVDDLRAICEAGSLRIYFLPQEPALQFCIHNANEPDTAVAYLKYVDINEDQDYYVELNIGEWHRNASRIWKDLQMNIPKVAENHGIFHSTVCFNIAENSNFRDSVISELKLKFVIPQVYEDVISLCFEGKLKNH